MRKPGDLPAAKQDQVRAWLLKNNRMKRKRPGRIPGSSDRGIRPPDPKGVPRVGGGHAPRRRWV